MIIICLIFFLVKMCGKRCSMLFYRYLVRNAADTTRGLRFGTESRLWTASLTTFSFTVILSIELSAPKHPGNHLIAKYFVTFGRFRVMECKLFLDTWSINPGVFAGLCEETQVCFPLHSPISVLSAQLTKTNEDPSVLPSGFCQVEY